MCIRDRRWLSSMEDANTAAIDTALERLDAHSAALRAAKESGTLSDDTLAALIARSLQYHREERATWRKAVQSLPGHLKVTSYSPLSFTCCGHGGEA